MEHKASYYKKLRIAIAVRAAMFEIVRMSAADIDGNGEKKTIAREINRFKKAMPTRRQKGRKHQELALRVKELKILKTEIRSFMDALTKIISHIEGERDLYKFKIEQCKRRIKTHPSENPFDFTEYAEMQKEENEINFGFFLELSEKNKIIYNQAPVNTLIEETRKLNIGFLRVVILL